MKISLIRTLATACAAAVAASFAFAADVSPNALKGKKILFVVGETKKDERNDDPLIREYLEARGASVKVATAADKAAAEGNDLVLISSTVNSRELGPRYRSVPVPVVTWNAYNFGELDMTGKELHKDFSVIREQVFHNANHAAYYAYATSDTKPIIKAADLPRGIFSPLTFSAGETDPNWGRPTLSADVSVYFEGAPEKAAVFSYEKGSLMANDTPAPARRVGLFLGNDSFSVLTDATGPAAQDKMAYNWYAGRRVVDAALRWAVSPPEAPVKRIEPAQSEAQLAKDFAGKKILYARRFDMPWPANEAADQSHLKWLRSLGAQVTEVDQAAPEMSTAGYDLVLFSATTNKYKIGNKYTQVGVPIVVLEAKAVDSFHMTSRRRNTDYGVNDHKESIYPPENYLQIVRPTHPLAAGLPAGLFKLYKTPGVLAWSVVPPGAEVIASIPNQPQHGTFYSYERGSTMANDHIAPARRVLFPMDATRFPDLTDEGRVLYGRTLVWAISDSRK